MKFLIRDDDTCAFTEPDELISCYRDIWDDIPVNLSVTPFRIPGNDKTLKREHKGLHEVLPLENNNELVSFLKEKIVNKNISIAMHGYNHTKPNGLPEYIGADNLFEKTKKGKKYIENILNTKIDTFVPPNNGILKEGISAVSENNMNLIGMPSFIRPGHRPFDINNIQYFVRAKYYRKFHSITYPYVVNLKNHKEVGYYSVTPSQEFDFLKKNLDKIYELDGVFILSVHYHAFRRNLKSGEKIDFAVNKIIEQVMSYKNVQYVSYKELWKD